MYLKFSHDEKKYSCQTLFCDAVSVPSRFSISTLPSSAGWHFALLLSIGGHRMATVASGITFAFRARGKEGTATNPSVLLLRKVKSAPEPSSEEFLSLLTGQNQATWPLLRTRGAGRP